MSLRLAGMAGLVTWYLPKELSQLKEKINDSNNTLRESIRSDSLKDLNPLQVQIARLTALIETSRPDAARSLPEAMKNSLRTSPRLGLQTVKAITEKAKEEDIRSDPEEIAQVGREILALDSGTEGDLAWQATTELINYRSLLNKALLPIPGPKMAAFDRKPDFLWHMLIPFLGISEDQKKQVSYGALGVVPIEHAANVGPIGQVQNEKIPVGPKLIVIQANGPGPIKVFLDAFHLKNVILRNIAVTYHGGPTVLDNVLFVNCTFEINHGDNGKLFAQHVLDSRRNLFKIS